MKDKKYKEAYELIEKQPDKYSKYEDECTYQLALQSFEKKDYPYSYELLKDNKTDQAKQLLAKVEPLYNSSIMASQIEYYLIQMNEEIESPSNGKYGIWKEGTGVYMNIGYRLNDLLENIDNKNSDLDIEGIYRDIFDTELNNNSEAKNKINELQKTVVWNTDHYHLYTVCNFIKDNKNTDTYFDDNDVGNMVIKNVNLFLKEKGISPKTLAYMLGIFKDYGAEILKSNETIVIKWDSSTRGYDYCDSKENDDIEKEWIDTYAAKAKIEAKEIKNNIGYLTCTIDNPNNLDFKYISMYVQFKNKNNKVLDTYYIKVKNVKDSKIIIPWEFEKIGTNTNLNYQFFICSALD